MTLYEPEPCHWCDMPRDAHPAYTALEGVHDWEPDIGPDMPAPRVIAHPEGGLTMPAQETPSPTLDELYGSCPNLTGGLDSVEYVRRMREADDARGTQPAQETPSDRLPAPWVRYPATSADDTDPRPWADRWDDHPPEQTSKHSMLSRLRNAMKGTS